MLEVVAQKIQQPAPRDLHEQLGDLREADRLADQDAKHRDVSGYPEDRKIGPADERQRFARWELHHALGVLGQLKDRRALAIT